MGRSTNPKDPACCDPYDPPQLTNIRSRTTMLEILILIKLCRQIGEMARKKARRAWGYQLMLVLFWFGGEIGGAFFAGLVLLLCGEEIEDYLILVYLSAIAGAALGAWTAFVIVKILPEQADESEDDWSANDSYDSLERRADEKTI
jgi:hypothetical protein